VSELPPVDPVVTTLRPLLARQLGRLRARFLWHGLGKVLALAFAAVLLFFALDRWIGMPLPIRLFHTAAIVAIVAFGAVRYLVYPLRARILDLDLAVWFERTFPALHQRLVSAIQLHDVPPGDLRNQSRPMIDRLVADTAAAVQTLPLPAMFDGRTTRRWLLGAGSAAALLLGGALWSPPTAKAFVLRHLGFAASYPRDTMLRLELPSAGPELQRTDRGDQTELVLAAGADLHVSVLAEGVVPKEVFLDLRPLRAGADAELDGRSVAMAPRPGDRFRHIFRRLSGSFEFHARGGDDEHGDRTVVVRTVLPPQVATLAAEVVPPAYTGLTMLPQNGAIEALVGSAVTLTVTTTAPVRSAVMVFLESGRRLELGTVAPQDDSGVGTTWRTQFALEASDRYQIELLGDNGLRNPNPGTYPLVALQDYSPVGRWLLPDDEGTLLLPTALLCVRVDGRDDFGLRSVELVVERGGERSLTRALLTAPADAAVLTELLEVRELLGPPTGPGDGSSAPPAGAAAARSGSDGLVLSVQLRDNKQPQAGQTDLPRRIVQIVDEPQLAAAIARSFRGLREELAQALSVQTDRRTRLEDLLAASAAADAATTLTAIEVGQGRVASTAERVHRGLMRAFDLHLWNRLDPSQHAAAVIERYRQHSRGLQEAVSLDPVFYRELARARADGTLGAMEQALDPILLMIGIADGIASEQSPALARELAEAQVARSGADRTRWLQQAQQSQQRIEAGLQQLLLRLEEWNDYQDLVQEVRALRDRQRSLQDRTEEAKGKK
jgi:hypothetical protein